MKKNFFIFATVVFILLNNSRLEANLELVDTYQLPESDIKVYQTNYQGMLGDYGLLVRHERRLLPGFTLRKSIYKNNHFAYIKITTVSASTIHLQLCGIECKPEYENFDVSLKRFVYF